jgi:uncharacterized protein YehS (DUF1456 family)
MPLTNNDTLRRLRYSLDLRDTALEEIFKLGGATLTRTEILNVLKKEGDPEYTDCSDKTLASFLDGLIIKRRGKKEGAAPAPAESPLFLSNNVILKKIRIALELHEEDMISIMKVSGFDLSRAELSALFRNKEHKNYKECGDQFLRNFLAGLKDYLEKKAE